MWEFAIDVNVLSQSIFFLTFFYAGFLELREASVFPLPKPMTSVQVFNQHRSTMLKCTPKSTTNWAMDNLKAKYIVVNI